MRATFGFNHSDGSIKMNVPGSLNMEDAVIDFHDNGVLCPLMRFGTERFPATTRCTGYVMFPHDIKKGSAWFGFPRQQLNVHPTRKAMTKVLVYKTRVVVHSRSPNWTAVKVYRAPSTLEKKKWRKLSK